MIHKSTIVVIEDESDLLDIYRVVLGNLGEVEGFTSPFKFLEAVTRKVDPLRPALVITDLSMPELDGVKMIAQAQAHGCQFQSILVSGNIDRDAAIMASNIGVSNLIEKPVSKTKLIGAVNIALAMWECGQIRDDIRSLMVQMRELTEAFTMICERDFIDVMNEELYGPSASNEVVSLSQAFKNVEKKLDELSRDENLLEMKKQRLVRETSQKKAA